MLTSSKRDGWKPWAKRGDEVTALIIECLKDGKKHRYTEISEYAVNKHISTPTLVKHLNKLVLRNVINRDAVSAREVYYQLSVPARFGDIEMQLIHFKNNLAKMLDTPKEFSQSKIIRQLVKETHNLFFYDYSSSEAFESEFISIIGDKIVVARVDDLDMNLIKDGLKSGAAVSGRFSLRIQSYDVSKNH